MHFLLLKLRVTARFLCSAVRLCGELGLSLPSPYLLEQNSVLPPPISVTTISVCSLSV